MKILTVALLCVLFLASPVFGQSQTEEVTFKHDLTVQMEGTWELDHEFQSGETTNSITLSGEGAATVRSILEARRSYMQVPVWWDLF